MMNSNIRHGNINTYNSVKPRPVSFKGGLKNNIKIGEAILNEVYNAIPVTNSNSRINLKLSQHRNKNQFANLLEKLEILEEKYGTNVYTVREEMHGKYMFDEYLKKYIETVNKYRAANCGEYAELAQLFGLKKGVKVRQIHFDIKNIKTDKEIEGKDHTFAVMGLKKNVDILNPTTWGSKAVIIDGWIGKRTEAARDMIEHYKTIFGFDPAKHKIEFSEKVILDIDAFLAHQNQPKKNLSFFETLLQKYLSFIPQSHRL